MPSLSRAERNERALKGELGIQNLGRRALNGTMISFGGQVARMGLQFASIAILARLLSPADFGLVAMAFTITSFVSMFTDLGLSTATLQREKLSQELVSTLFFINVIVGIGLMLVTMAIAPLAALVYGDSRITLLAICLSLAIPLTSSGAQHGALLGRAMRWVPIQIAYLVGQASGLAMAIALLVLFDIGYWALVVQAIVTAVAQSLVNWTLCDWRPDATCNWRIARAELNFGLNLTGFNLANWFHRQLDKGLIGWRWGPTELGHYTRAYNMLTMPINFINGPISAAVVPLLSRKQSEPREWERYYLTGLFGSCLVGYFIAALLYLNSSEIIMIVLGGEWGRAAAVFALLAFSMLPSTPMNTAGWVYISLGRTNRMFRWGLFNSVACVVAFVVGLPNGAPGVAGAYSVVLALMAVPGLAYAVKESHTTLAKTLRVIVGPLVITLATIGLTKLAMGEIHQESPFVRLVLQSAIASAIYLPLSALQLWFDPTQSEMRRIATTFLQAAKGWRHRMARGETAGVTSPDDKR